MIISTSRNFIFIHLEKCGGTSVEVAFEPYLDETDIIFGSTQHGERKQAAYFEKYGTENVKKNMLWKHSIAKNICNNIGKQQWDSFNKISIVRNPIDLMISLYLFSETVITYHIGKINKQRWRQMIRNHAFPQAFPYNEKYIEAYVRSDIEKSGFDGFTAFLLKENPLFVHPQIERLRGYEEQQDLGLVIELSQLNDRWHEVLDLVGIEDDVPIGKLNKSYKHKVEVSDTTSRLIKSRFAVDYEELPRYTGVTW